MVLQEKISILHCHSEYPSNIKDLNLKNISTFKKKFGYKIGFSDHTIGSLASIIATSLGAEIIEKHITLNKKFYGPDHSSSLEVKSLSKFVENIKSVKLALGSYKLNRSVYETRNKKIVRKSIVAKKKIKIGDIFSEKNLACKRPGTGLSPIFFEKIIGKKSKFNFKENQFIKI